MGFFHRDFLPERHLNREAAVINILIRKRLISAALLCRQEKLKNTKYHSNDSQQIECEVAHTLHTVAVAGHKFARDVTKYIYFITGLEYIFQIHISKYLYFLSFLQTTMNVLR